MAAMIFSGLNERRREMAILRTIGARPVIIVGLLMLEAVAMALLASLLGIALLYAVLVVAQPLVDARFGLFLPIEPPSAYEAGVVAAVILAAAVTSLGPAWRAYRLSLSDGTSVRS
jgi:putative ABC transport system permease protein